MIGLVTPTKADDEIGRITTDLSAKWGLQFPPPILRSPAKIDRERLDEKALSRLRYVFFYDWKNNRAATKYAIESFEQFAPKLLAGWIPKPRADDDVLPTRTRSATSRQQTFLSKRPTLNDEQASDLMLAFLRFLDETIEAIRKGAVFAVDTQTPRDKANGPGSVHILEEEHSKPLRRSSRTSSEKATQRVPSAFKNGSIKKYLMQRSNDPPPPPLDFHAPKHQLPSSDDYKVDEGLFDDVEMQDAPNDAIPRGLGVTVAQAANKIGGSSDSAESLEDRYQTPPDSPSKIPIESQRGRAKPRQPTTTVLYKSSRECQPALPRGQTPGTVAYPSITSLQANSVNSLGQNRKRTFPDVPKPDLPRKVSRDNANHSSAGVNKVQPIQSTKYVESPDFHKRPSNSRKNTRSFQRSCSTGSLTSMTSSATTMATSAWTTPNTSFMTETPMSSFTSSNELIEVAHPEQDTLHARRSWETLKAPFGLGLDVSMDLSGPEVVQTASMGPPAFPPVRRTQERPIQELLSRSPFAPASPNPTLVVHLRQLYEVYRVSTQTKVPIGDFTECLTQVYDDYESLWSKLVIAAKNHNATVPERSSATAWRESGQGFKGVVLSGTLAFVDKPGEDVFDFKLNPLKVEPTYRLARKFGNDRFFILNVPGIESRHLPVHLRSDPNARQAILDWLVYSEHSLLGRKWRAFYVKPEKRKRSGLTTRSSLEFRVYLFAESGRDFRANGPGGEGDPRTFDHQPMSRKQLIEWLMPSKANKSQRALKFFARLAIGVSQTTAALQFRPLQIIRSGDARADVPAKRKLQHQRSFEKKTKLQPWKSHAAVMNDGCARISMAAAQAVAESLHLDYVPSIFQGRIAGAKGVWMVDPSNEKISGPSENVWIEITDSQLKFEANDEDHMYPDPERVTFEVLAFSRPLVPASLNFQLMPILEERKVPSSIFRDLLEADLTTKVAELEVAMGSGLAIRMWNQDVNPVSGLRDSLGVEMHGGMPVAIPEKINWFVEHGFEPSSCCRLKDILYSAILGYCLRLENRMNIGVAKSTYAFMIADPLAVLEEGEIHLSFSTGFDNKNMLHGLDVLVARLPAALPSDIQKVRAVFKVELRFYLDVVVFSSKGSRSLAEKLSGGDYDGDKAWICWEPRIVEPFQNVPMVEAPSLESYGISVESKTVDDFLMHEPGEHTSGLLRYAFDFTFKGSLLGICTSYFESLCYSENSIAKPSAMKIAHLLGLLVDTAKAGIIFNDETWNAFLKKEGLPKSLPKPAYKEKARNIPTRPKHLIDQLVFVVAKGVREKALGDFSRRFKAIGTYDVDLVALYRNEQQEMKEDGGIALALKDLKADLHRLRDFWATNCRGSDDIPDDEAGGLTRSFGRKSVLPFAAVAEHVRDEFLGLEPSAAAIAQSPVVRRWAQDLRSNKPIRELNTVVRAPSFKADPGTPPSSPVNHWALLKASTAFSMFHNTNFIWYIAGPELGILKATAKGMGGFRTVTKGMWECMKMDRKMVERRKARERNDAEMEMYGELDAGEGVEIGDEYGSWGWVDGVDA